MENNIKKNDYLVAKDNHLIEAKYRLSVSEQKLILILISKIMPEDEDFKIYRFRISEFSDLFNVRKDSFYKEIIKLTFTLAEKALKIYDPVLNKTIVTNWFASADYHHKEGRVEFEFSSKLKPYLLQLKNRFTGYSLDKVIQLKSSYSIRIYELIKQYEKVGYRTFSITELKKILALEEGEYSQYAHFRQRVLEPAQKELAEKTDLRFTFDTIKEARKVCYVRLDIYPNTIEGEYQEDEKKGMIEKKTIDFDIISHPDFVPLIRLVPKEHRGKTSVINIITKFFKKGDYKYIERNIKYANKNSQTNYQAYLNKTLNADWGLEIQEEEETKQAIAQKTQSKRKEESKHDKLSEKLYNDACLIYAKLSKEEQAAKLALYYDPSAILSDSTKTILVIHQELLKNGVKHG